MRTQRAEDLALDCDQLAAAIERKLRDGTARMMEKTIRLPTKNPIAEKPHE
jgi:hypothetical protein